MPELTSGWSARAQPLASQRRGLMASRGRLTQAPTLIQAPVWALNLGHPRGVPHVLTPGRGKT